MIDVSIRDFSKAAAIVCAAIEKRNTIPVLGTMRARANGRLVLDGGNLDMTATASIPCDSKSDTTLLIDDPRALVSAIGAAGGQSFTLAKLDDGFRAQAGALNRVSRHRQPVDDWPDHRCSVDEVAFSASLGAEAIRQMERVSRAISKEETRYYLNGMYIEHVKDWTYRLVATDGHRLMMADIELPDAAGELVPQIIPRQFVHTILTHFRKVDGPIGFRVGAAWNSNAPDVTLDKPKSMVARVAMAATVGPADVTFSGKVIDGTFPAYGRVVPTRPAHQAIFSVGDLRQAVQALSAGLGRWPAIAFSFGPDGCELGASSAEGVVATYRVESKHNVRDGLKIGLNGHYVVDMLASIGGEQISIGIDDAAAPTLWKSIDDTSFTGALMPVRLQ